MCVTLISCRSMGNLSSPPEPGIFQRTEELSVNWSPSARLMVDHKQHQQRVCVCVENIMNPVLFVHTDVITVVMVTQLLENIVNVTQLFFTSHMIYIMYVFMTSSSVFGVNTGTLESFKMEVKYSSFLWCVTFTVTFKGTFSPNVPCSPTSC